MSDNPGGAGLHGQPTPRCPRCETFVKAAEEEWKRANEAESELRKLRADLAAGRERENKLRKHWGRKRIYRSQDGRFFLMDGTSIFYDTENEAIDVVCGITNTTNA